MDRGPESRLRRCDRRADAPTAVAYLYGPNWRSPVSGDRAPTKRQPGGRCPFTTARKGIMISTEAAKKYWKQRQAALDASDTAAADLRAALVRHGLVIPSLRSSEPVNHQGFVELGGCRADVAAHLAQVLDAAADAMGEGAR